MKLNCLYEGGERRPSKAYSDSVLSYRRRAVKELRREIGELLDPVLDGWHRVRSEFQDEWMPYLEEADELIGGGLGGSERYWNNKFEKAQSLVAKVKNLRKEAGRRN